MRPSLRLGHWVGACDDGAMAGSPLDPRFWMQGIRDAAAGDASWLDTWTDLTTWWVEPTVNATRSLRVGSDQVLVQLIDGVATQFGGRNLQATVRDQPVTAELDSVRLLHRRDRRELRLDLSDVDAGEITFDQLRIVVRRVRLDVGVRMTLHLRDIEVDGIVAAPAMVAWLEGRTDPWRLRLTPDGAIEARPASSPLRLTISPRVDDDVVVVEAVEARYGRVRIPIPSWLRIHRRVPLDLEPGWHLPTAIPSAGTLRFRLEIDALTEELDPRLLREAILRRGVLPF